MEEYRYHESSDEHEDDIEWIDADWEEEEPQSPPPSIGSEEERQWCLFTHIGGFAGYIIPLVGDVLVPLILLATKREEMSAVDAHGRAAINFQASISVYFFISWVLASYVIGIFMMVGVVLLHFVSIIQAMNAVNKNEVYKYPLSIPFLDVGN